MTAVTGSVGREGLEDRPSARFHLLAAAFSTNVQVGQPSAVVPTPVAEVACRYRAREAQAAA